MDVGLVLGVTEEDVRSLRGDVMPERRGRLTPEAEGADVT
jgi:hypothetical protein